MMKDEALSPFRDVERQTAAATSAGRIVCVTRKSRVAPMEAFPMPSAKNQRKIDALMVEMNKYGQSEERRREIRRKITILENPPLKASRRGRRRD